MITKLLMVSALLLACEAGISDNCIDCIGIVEDGNPNSCHEDHGSLSCGTYEIKYDYWKDCTGRSSGLDAWKSCAENDTCARSCIRSYMARYGHNCSINPTCYDYGRLHNGGPGGCQSKATDAYVAAMKRKCNLKDQFFVKTKFTDLFSKNKVYYRNDKPYYYYNAM